ncbi:MAG: SAM-dependent chlorinase/fluorinase [Hydrogenothermaceae bacterium]|nr:SAM-dependent chlorinase/fluorinase [Hydrogenothermaceae bacterium]
MAQVVALLTDFGTKDGFVGAVKGVMLSINPNITIVDISHEIEPFDILEASLILKSTYRYFPTGTVFLSVVDPGVGTDRKAIIVKTSKYIFVSPDNGLLTLPLKEEMIESIISITNRDYFLKTDTNTFHGRDIFAPVVGYISKGEPLHNFGKELQHIVKIENLEPKKEEDRIIGKVLKFDRFGNAVTNLESLPSKFKVRFKGFEIDTLCNNFLEGKEERPNLIKGSFGFYELFIPRGSLRETLKVQVGEQVEVYRT